MEYIIAIMPALCFGSLFILLGLIKTNTNKQVFATSFAAFIISFVFIGHVSHISLLVGVFSGIFWTIGFYYQIKCFKKAGASIAVPMSNGLQLLFASLISLIFFNEFNTYSIFILIFILILGIFLVSYKENKEKSNLDKTYYKYLLISTIAFMGYLTSTKLFNIDAKAILFPQTFGMLIAVVYMNRKNLKDLVDIAFFKAMIVGVVWFLGNVCMFFTITNLGLGVAFSMSQLSIAFSTILGLVVLKENKTKKELILCLLGIVLLIIAGVGIGYIGG